jgi:hypothetical protein
MAAGKDQTVRKKYLGFICIFENQNILSLPSLLRYTY